MGKFKKPSVIEIDGVELARPAAKHLERLEQLEHKSLAELDLNRPSMVAKFIWILAGEPEDETPEDVSQWLTLDRMARLKPLLLGNVEGAAPKK